MSSRSDADLESLFAQRTRLWRAQFALATERPQESARRLLTRRAVGAFAAAGWGLAVLTAVDRTLPLVVLFFAGAAVSAAASVERVTGLVNEVLSRRTTPRAHVLGPLPHVAVLVALSEDARAVPRLVESLRALDYPDGHLEILLTGETGTATASLVAARVATHDDPRFVVVDVPAADGSVGTAWNFALAGSACHLVVAFVATQRPASAMLLEASDRFAAENPSLASVVAPRRGSWASRPSLVAAWAALSHGFDDGVAIHRRADVDAVGGWDPFSHDPALDLRLRLRRAGCTEDRLTSAVIDDPPADVVAYVGRRAKQLAASVQCGIVDHRARGARVPGHAATNDGLHRVARLPLAIVRPALFVTTLAILFRPHAAGDLRAALPASAAVPAFMIYCGALGAWGAGVTRALPLGPRYVIAALLRPLWSLVDLCAALKASIILANVRTAPHAPERVEVPESAPLVAHSAVAV
jgi:hypothetical protein